MSNMGYIIQIVMAIATPVLSALAAWFAAKFKAVKKRSDEQERRDGGIARACVLLMGQRLDDLCSRYEKQQAPHSPEQTQHLLDEWEIYAACGGDGVRTARVERVTGIRLKDLEEGAKDD